AVVAEGRQLMLQTRSQRFAKYAYEKVSHVESNKSEYKRAVRSLPTLIRTAGLAQALAFIEKDHGDLVAHLSQTVNAGNNLSQTCRNAPLYEYMRLTRDTLDALVWYKRFAE